jgi:hypothetical protein
MSYSNYSTYLKYKNCCRPIGDTGPPGSIGPTGPAATLDVPGNKGEILYFSETNTLDSTHTIFITNGNVSVNNNLVVTGNLSMNNNFINDVSGIYFSDTTYIGHGSSFDITTSERLDISAVGGVTVTGNLTVNDATIVNKTFDVIGNTTLENLFVNGSINNLIEISGNTIQPIISESVNLGYDESGSSNDKRFNLGFFNRIKSRTAVIVGNLTMDDSSITNVDNISSVNNLTIQASDGVIIRGNLTVDDATTFKSDTTINANLTINAATTIDRTLTVDDATTLNGNLNFKSADHISSSGSSIAINTLNLNINAATTINSNLSMNDNFINDVSGIYFTRGNLLFSDFSSVNQSVQLPSSQGQPISLERKTLFYDDNFNNNIPGSSPFIIDFTNTNKVFNQLNLIVSGNILQPSPDISGQYVEIYANFDVSSNTSPTKTFSLDISSVSGVSFFETIDVRSISKQGNYYLTFGPHIFIPSQWENTTGFNFIINNETSSPFYINKYKLMFKSYFM